MQSEEEYNKEYLTTSASSGIRVTSPSQILQVTHPEVLDNSNQEEDDRHSNELDSFKLTRRQKRSIFKNQKMSNRIKQLTNVKYV